MGLAFETKFVMHTVLAWAASHRSWMTKDPAARHQAYGYRVRALQGLQIAIETFSTKNSDAILAASVMLGWQATDP